MARTRPVRRWGLKQIEVEFSAIFAKVRLVFARKRVPARAPLRKRAEARKTVQSELARVQSAAPNPPNVIADTVAQIAQRERKRAIREGDYDDAIVAAIIEYYAGLARGGKAR